MSVCGVASLAHEALDAAHLGPRPGRDHDRGAAAARDRGAAEHHAGPVRERRRRGPTGSARLATGRLSPVSMASLTRRSRAETTRASAGTTVPGSSSIRSPGTTASGGIACGRAVAHDMGGLLPGRAEAA